MKLSFKQKFNTRQEISVLLGGDTQKGIAVSAQTDTILLFMNDGEIYTDYFYPTGSYSHCMYTGIGRRGHQDSPDENKHMYHLNIEVLSHRTNKMLVSGVHDPVLSGATNRFLSENRKPIDRIS